MRTILAGHLCIPLTICSFGTAIEAYAVGTVIHRLCVGAHLFPRNQIRSVVSAPLQGSLTGHPRNPTKFGAGILGGHQMRTRSSVNCVTSQTSRTIQSSSDNPSDLLPLETKAGNTYQQDSGSADRNMEIPWTSRKAGPRTAKSTTKTTLETASASGAQLHKSAPVKASVGVSARKRSLSVGNRVPTESPPEIHQRESQEPVDLETAPEKKRKRSTTEVKDNKSQSTKQANDTPNECDIQTPVKIEIQSPDSASEKRGKRSSSAGTRKAANKATASSTGGDSGDIMDPETDKTEPEAGSKRKRSKSQPKAEEGQGEPPSSDVSSSPASPKSSLKNKAVPTGSLSPPPGWRGLYDLTLELRRERDAPVDWAGSESLGIDRSTGLVDPYHTLIALMLSSQTKDQVVAEAMQALKARGLSVESVLAMSDAELDRCIAKVGFHNNKTKYIKQATALLKERHAGSVPATAHELCALPGVGPKMAYIILKVAFGIVSGIGVDTHMHRIFNQLGWVKSSTPEKVT